MPDRWNAWSEAKWLGIAPGWKHGPTFPTELYARYAETLDKRTVDFSGSGWLSEEIRQAFIDALKVIETDPEQAMKTLRAVLGPEPRVTEVEEDPEEDEDGFDGLPEAA